MKIVLPWPDKRLSPNARLHWAQKASVRKIARKEAALFTCAANDLREVRGRVVGDDPIEIQITFFPPDARHRDDDNMVGSFKAYRDGIADALGVNDRRFRPHYFFENPAKPGRVEVVIIGDNTMKKAQECRETGESLVIKGGPVEAPTSNPALAIDSLSGGRND